MKGPALALAFLLLALLHWSVAAPSPLDQPGSSGAGNQRKQAYAKGRVIVKFEDGGLSTAAAVAVAVKAAGVERQRAVGSGRAQLYKITDGSSVKAKLRQLRKIKGVKYVEPDYKVYASQLTPIHSGDPKYGLQWHLAKIRAPVAWGSTTGSKDVRVCVIDTGANSNHEDLQGAIVRGINYVGVEGNAPGGEQPWDWRDTFDHGTHVAGTIAAVSNNGKGVAGVAWQASLFICRFMGDNGEGYTTDAIRCLEWCRKNASAHFTSNSWGGSGFSQTLRDEIENCNAAGQLFFVAAGNDNKNIDVDPDYPAAYTNANVVAVAASTIDDQPASFTNFGKDRVDFAAPGVDILALGNATASDYEVMSGTSMATPMATGAAVLVKAAAMAANISLSHLDLKKLLESSVDPIAAFNGKVATGGRLNVAKAIKALLKLQGDPPLPPPPAGTLIDPRGLFAPFPAQMTGTTKGASTVLSASYNCAYLSSTTGAIVSKSTSIKGPQALFKFKETQSTTRYINSCGSKFDSNIVVFSSATEVTSLAGASFLTCVEDVAAPYGPALSLGCTGDSPPYNILGTNSGAKFNAFATVSTTAGMWYYILLGGYAGVYSGEYVLSVYGLSDRPAPSPSPPPPSPLPPPPPPARVCKANVGDTCIAGHSSLDCCNELLLSCYNLTSTLRRCYNSPRAFGQPCSAAAPCGPGLSCSSSGNLCLNFPRLEGQSCAGNNATCATGLSCEAGVRVCRAPRQLGEACHSTLPCGANLRCEATLNKCVRSPPELEEPCSSSIRCAAGFSCHPGALACYNSPRLEGQPCGADANSSCDASRSLTCEANFKICRAPRQLGESCHSSMPCGANLRCEPTLNQCVNSPGQTGDPCNTTAPCGTNWDCQNAKCWPKPREAGQPCGSTAAQACGQGLTCHAYLKVCVGPAGLGEDCFAPSAPCASGLTCVAGGAGQKCFGSPRQAGEPCTSSGAGRCAAGLVCPTAHPYCVPA